MPTKKAKLLAAGLAASMGLSGCGQLAGEKKTPRAKVARVVMDYECPWDVSRATIRVRPILYNLGAQTAKGPFVLKVNGKVVEKLGEVPGGDAKDDSPEHNGQAVFKTWSTITKHLDRPDGQVWLEVTGPPGVDLAGWSGTKLMITALTEGAPECTARKAVGRVAK